MSDIVHVFTPRMNKIPAKQLLGIDSPNKAMRVILIYGDSPSMLYGMDKEMRSEFAAALIEGCKAQGIGAEGIPPLWTGILDDPDLHEIIAQQYETE